MEQKTAVASELSRLSGDSRESSQLWRRLLILAVVVGVICRLRQYLANPSFWSDEAFIVMNLLELSYRGLLNQLHHGQAAPPLFLWIERAAMQVGGLNEYSLRALPLVCGTAALVFYAIAVRRILPPPMAFVAMATLALTERLIVYSAEVKQYIGDVMISTLLLMLATMPRQSPLRRLVQVTLAASILVWMSHPTVCVFGGVSAVLCLEIWRNGRNRERIIAFACNALMLASFATLYFFSIRIENSPWMHAAWHDDFPDYAHPASIPRWVIRQGYEFLASPYRMVGPLIVIAFFLGIGYLSWKRRFAVLGLLGGPILLSILAAFAQKYPFNSSRLTLYLLPQVFILCAFGFELLREVLPGKIAIAWWALAAPILAVAIGQGALHFVHPQYRSHIRPIVAYVRAHRAPGEGIYLAGVPGNLDPDPTVGRHLEFLCYWQHPDPPLHTLLPRSWRDAPEKRFWVTYAFHAEKGSTWQQALLNDVRAVADEKDHIIDPRGGAAYLFQKRE